MPAPHRLVKIQLCRELTIHIKRSSSLAAASGAEPGAGDALFQLRQL